MWYTGERELIQTYEEGAVMIVQRWTNISINNGMINMRRLIRGDAQILLVHGAATDGNCWDSWGDVFSEAGYPVSAIDLRGHGRSEGVEEIGTYSISDYVDDVRAAVKHMYTTDALHRKIILIGHSMGGLIAQIATDQLGSEYITKLVLIASATPSGIFLKSGILKLLVTRLKYITALLGNKPLDALVEDLQKLDLNNNVDFDNVVQSLKPESGKALREIVLWKHSVKDNLPCPVLVVTGKNDAVIPPPVQAKLVEKYGADQLMYEGGHLPLAESGSDQLMRDILYWVKARSLKEKYAELLQSRDGE